METEYVCDICKCSYARKSFLVNHLKSKKHLTRVSAACRFVCHCGKSYLHKRTLEIYTQSNNRNTLIYFLL